MTEQASATGTLEDLAKAAFRQQLTPEPTTPEPTTPEPTSKEPTATEPTVDANAITAGDIQAADDILAKIGAPPVIVVVPDDAPLGTASSGNAAVTIKQSGKVAYFKNMLDNFIEKGRYATDVGTAQRARIDVNVIVVKHVILRGDDLLRAGTIWHEYGHVLHGAAENGTVFAYELQCLRNVLDDDAARAFVKDHRKQGAYYTEAAGDPGLDQLQAQLEALGLQLTRGQKAKADAARAATALQVGKRLRGRPARLKALAKATTDLPDEARTLALDDTFPWAGYTWRLAQRDMVYTIKVVGENNRGREQFSGTSTQLKGAAGAQKEPPLAPGTAPGTPFQWDGSGWELVSSEPDLDLEVVAVADAD